MSMSDPNSSLKKRSRRGNSEMDDFIIEDDNDFVIVNRKPSANLSKNLLSSVTSAEDEFIMADEEILAGGGDFRFGGGGMTMEGEELQGKGEESESSRREEGEESCLLQNGVEPRLNGEESEVPLLGDKLLQEAIKLPMEKVRLSQERGVESQPKMVESQPIKQKGVEPILLPEERGVESQLERVEPILLPEEEVELRLPQERGVESEGERVESNLLQEPIAKSPDKWVESHPLMQEGAESPLSPAVEESSSAAERGGVISLPQELSDTFT